jgi:hypothetical protein
MRAGAIYWAGIGRAVHAPGEGRLPELTGAQLGNPPDGRVEKRLPFGIKCVKGVARLGTLSRSLSYHGPGLPNAPHLPYGA